MKTENSPLTMPWIHAMTVYAPTGSFRIDHVTDIRIADRFKLPLKAGDKIEHFMPPRVLVQMSSGQLEFYGLDGKVVLVELEKKGYYETETDVFDRFEKMLKEFNAMFDDDPAKDDGTQATVGGIIMERLPIEWTPEERLDVASRLAVLARLSRSAARKDEALEVINLVLTTTRGYLRGNSKRISEALSDES